MRPDHDKLPKTRINLLFRNLNLMYDRAIVRQILKIYVFILKGSFRNSIDDLVNELEKPLISGIITFNKVAEDISPEKIMKENLMKLDYNLKPSGRRYGTVKKGDVKTFQKSIGVEDRKKLQVNLIFEGLKVTVLEF